MRNECKDILRPFNALFGYIVTTSEGYFFQTYTSGMQIRTCQWSEVS